MKNSDSKALYEKSEDFKFAPVPLTKEDSLKGMLYHEDKAGDISEVQSEDQNTEVEKPA